MNMRYVGVGVSAKFLSTLGNMGDRGGTVVKVMCYKSEGRWIDPSWCPWNTFSALGSRFTQQLC